MSRGRGRARAFVFLIAAFGLLGAGGVFWLRGGHPASVEGLPTAEARAGEFLVIVPCRGELVADRSVQVTAPLNVPNLQIVWMATPGAPVEGGQVILRFDTSGAERQLKEKDAELSQTRAQLAEAQAQAQMTIEQNLLELSTLRTAAERARLETTKAETLSAIQAEEKRIDYGLALDKVRVQEAATELARAQSNSRIESLKSVAARHEAQVALTNRRIAQMEVRAPSAGVVNYQMNYSQGWMNAKPFKVGDSVWPGSAVAEIPDLGSLRIKASVEEIERGRIRAGQAARIQLDPFPEKPFPGKLDSISALTEQNFEWPPSRNFRAYGSFAEIDARLRPAMNGRLDIIVDRIENAISVPARAVFARDGQPVVLVPGPKGLQPVFVEVLARNPDEVAVRGIAAGTRVALVEEPTGARGGKREGE